MTPWTSSFLNVQYEAKQFAMAFEEANSPLPYRQQTFYRSELARAKMKLEIALAVYKKESVWIKQKR